MAGWAKWRKEAEQKAEDLRQLLIDFDFQTDEADAAQCRMTLCLIEGKVQEIRAILARE